jgi:hypothetical protein
MTPGADGDSGGAPSEMELCLDFAVTLQRLHSGAVLK